MSLSDAMMDALNKLARQALAVRGSRSGDINVNLFNVKDEDDMERIERELRGYPDEVVSALADRVEYHSLGRRTVCQASSVLFKYPAKAPTVFQLVVCDNGRHEGVVRELTRDMTLIEVTPYINGVTVNCMKASQETIKASNAAAASKKLAHDNQREDEAQVRAFMAHLKILLQMRADAHDDSVVRVAVLHAIQTTPELTLVTMAGLCRKLGISLEELARTI